MTSIIFPTPPQAYNQQYLTQVLQQIKGGFQSVDQSIASPAVINNVTRNGYWVQPFINVQADYNASGVGGTMQDAEINAAIAAANESGRQLWFPPGDYDFASPLDTITKNGVSVEGAGQNSTRLRCWATSGNSLTFTGQFPAIRNLTLWPILWKSSGYEVSFEGTYRGLIENVLSQYHHNAFNIESCAQPEIRSCTTLFAHGDQHINMIGSALEPVSGLFIAGHSSNNAHPVTDTTYKAFGPGQSFTEGQFTDENNYCWQCVQSGTTAGSGTLTPPMSYSYVWAGAAGNVTHGSAAFRMLSTTTLAGCRMDSFAYSLSIARSAFINGAYGFAMTDGAATGSSYPKWMASDDLQADHCFFAGVHASGGIDINLGVKAWIGSTLAGNGITLVPGFRGSFKMLGARVSGNLQNGMYMGAGIDNMIGYCQFSENSSSSFGTYNDIVIDSGVSAFDISHNRFGSEDGGTPNTAYVGCLVVSGASDDYIISHNRGRDLSSGLTVFDGGTGVNKVVANNLYG